MAAISVVTFGNSKGQNENCYSDVSKTDAKKTTKKDITRLSNSSKIAVTRRNARERNRVKQVNNGFLTLRQHIPTEIATAFENGNGNGRSNNKKMSKVETLRMAVEYIRSLKAILSSGSEDEPKSMNVPVLKTFQQYMRIPGTDAYQLTNTFAYEDEENIRPNGELLDDNEMFNSNVGSPYSNESSVCSPGGATDGLKEQFQTLPPIEVLQPLRGGVIRNNFMRHPNHTYNGLDGSMDYVLDSSNQNLTVIPPSNMPVGLLSSVSNSSSLYSSDSNDYIIKSEPLSDQSDLTFEHLHGGDIVKTEDGMIDVMDWWENNTKLTAIES